MTHTTISFVLTPLLLGMAIFLLTHTMGCGRQELPQADKRSESSTKMDTDQPVETELKYVLLKAFESGLNQLRGIAIDAQNDVYLAGAEGIRVLNSEGKLLLGWRTSGAARCVAVDENGNVYVGLRTKVEKYDKDGKMLGSWGAEGKGKGEFGVVTAIAIAGTDVFVADAGNRCIHRFDTTGDFINEIGKRDRESGFLGLICPSPYLDCALDADGHLYVTNPGQLRVEKYQIDGGLLGYWGKPGTRPERFCGCCNPTNIALTKSGQIVTAEKGIPRVKVYDTNGKMLAFIGSEFFSRGAAGLDLAVDSEGRIYVVDPRSGKVQVFGPSL